MNKIWLVTQREYLNKVKNKTFLITTFLAPLGFLLFFAAVGFVASRGSDEKKVIKVVDPSGILHDSITTGMDNITFDFTNESIENLKQSYKAKTFDGILELPLIKDSLIRDYAILYHSDDQLALDESSAISRVVGKGIRDYKLIKLRIDSKMIEALDTDVDINPKGILEKSDDSSMTTAVSAGLGMVVGYLMFFIILLYGAQVMRSVMEEKINRIVEVLISSIQPYQLMMGKVLGVGLVGLTQVAIWMILMPIIFGIGSSMMGIDPAVMQGQTLPPEIAGSAAGKMTSIMHELSKMNWMLIVPLCIFYFLAGYFTYAALFAAVGSAVGEDINEANSLTFPLMMPLMFGFYISLSAIKAPNSSLVEWASMIPLLSSVVMPVRLPFDPPVWQIIVSCVLLILAMIFFVWLAARIYRVGILMYGKKASFKELAKWIFYKG
jgi:ABC-2 type transport system permease protein